VWIGAQVGLLSNEAQVTDVQEKFCSPRGPDRRRSGPCQIVESGCLISCLRFAGRGFPRWCRFTLERRHSSGHASPPVALSSTNSCASSRLPVWGVPCHGDEMFVVTEADAAAIRAIFNEEGKLSAAIELRRRFPRLGDHTQARECARTISGRTPPAARACTVTRLNTLKNA
jgi:hypothetical protein